MIRQNRTKEMRTQINLFRASLHPPELLSGQTRMTTYKKCENKSSKYISKLKKPEI